MNGMILIFDAVNRTHVRLYDTARANNVCVATVVRHLKNLGFVGGNYTEAETGEDFMVQPEGWTNPHRKQVR